MNSTKSHIPKAPIYNPYDKFNKQEFDAWIGDITSTLRKALRHDSDEEPKPRKEEKKWYYAVEEESQGGYESGGEEQVEEGEVRRVKGKERDPREGPGLAAGTVNEPIELESDDEEGEGGEVYDDDDEGDEGEGDRGEEERDFDDHGPSFRHQAPHDNIQDTDYTDPRLRDLWADLNTYEDSDSPADSGVFLTPGLLTPNGGNVASGTGSDDALLPQEEEAEYIEDEDDVVYSPIQGSSPIALPPYGNHRSVPVPQYVISDEEEEEEVRSIYEMDDQRSSPPVMLDNDDVDEDDGYRRDGEVEVSFDGDVEVSFDADEAVEDENQVETKEITEPGLEPTFNDDIDSTSLVRENGNENPQPIDDPSQTQATEVLAVETSLPLVDGALVIRTQEVPPALEIDVKHLVHGTYSPKPKPELLYADTEAETDSPINSPLLLPPTGYTIFQMMSQGGECETRTEGLLDVDSVDVVGTVEKDNHDNSVDGNGYEVEELPEEAVINRERSPSIISVDVQQEVEEEDKDTKAGYPPDVVDIQEVEDLDTGYPVEDEEHGREEVMDREHEQDLDEAQTFDELEGGAHPENEREMLQLEKGEGGQVRENTLEETGIDLIVVGVDNGVEAESVEEEVLPVSLSSSDSQTVDLTQSQTLSSSLDVAEVLPLSWSASDPQTIDLSQSQSQTLSSSLDVPDSSDAPDLETSALQPVESANGVETVQETTTTTTAMISISSPSDAAGPSSVIIDIDDNPEIEVDVEEVLQLQEARGREQDQKKQEAEDNDDDEAVVSVAENTQIFPGWEQKSTAMIMMTTSSSQTRSLITQTLDQSKMESHTHEAWSLETSTSDKRKGNGGNDDLSIVTPIPEAGQTLNIPVQGDLESYPANPPNIDVHDPFIPVSAPAQPAHAEFESQTNIPILTHETFVPELELLTRNAIPILHSDPYPASLSTPNFDNDNDREDEEVDEIASEGENEDSSDSSFEREKEQVQVPVEEGEGQTEREPEKWLIDIDNEEVDELVPTPTPAIAVLAMDTEGNEGEQEQEEEEMELQYPPLETESTTLGLVPNETPGDKYEVEFDAEGDLDPEFDLGVAGMETSFTTDDEGFDVALNGHVDNQELGVSGSTSPPSPVSQSSSLTPTQPLQVQAKEPNEERSSVVDTDSGPPLPVEDDIPIITAESVIDTLTVSGEYSRKGLGTASSMLETEIITFSREEDGGADVESVVKIKSEKEGEQHSGQTDSDKGKNSFDFLPVFTVPSAPAIERLKSEISKEIPVPPVDPVSTPMSPPIEAERPVFSTLLEPFSSPKKSNGESGRTRRSKRKRKAPVTSQAGSSVAGPSANVEAEDYKKKALIMGKDKGKGKKKELGQDISDTASTSSANAAARMLTGDSRASSVVSTSTGDGSIQSGPSPTLLRAKDVAPSTANASSISAPPLPPPPPPPPQLMLHNHARKPALVKPTLTLQTQIQKTIARAPSFQVNPARSSSSQQASSPVTAHSDSRSGTPVPVQSPHNLRREPSSNSPVTRSHCRYHKISLLEDEGGPHIFFLVPGCSLVNRKLIKEEEIEDHGDATYEDSIRKVADIETLGINDYIIGVIRLLVGPDKEQEVYFLPKPGEERARQVTHTHRRSNLSRSNFTASSSSAGFSSPRASYANHNFVFSPSSSSVAAPVSAAGSSSTNRSQRPRKSRRDKEAEASLWSETSTDTDAEYSGSDHEHEFKKPKLAHPSEGAELPSQQSSSQTLSQTESASAGPGPRSSKLRAKASRKRALDKSAAEYKPGEDEDAGVSDEELPRPKKSRKNPLKRARNSEVESNVPLKKTKSTRIVPHEFSH